MKKIAAFASCVALSLAAGSTYAAVLDVTATFTGIVSGTGNGTLSGTGTGTYDIDNQVLTLATEYSVINNGGLLLTGSMNQTGETIIDFSVPSGTNEVLSCTNVSGLLCLAVPTGWFWSWLLWPLDLDSITGAWQSFETTSTYLGATTVQSWSVTASEVPAPAAAWLFGSSLLGMLGAAFRRKATA